MSPMTTDFKPRFTWETFRHDKWTYLFCRGAPTMDACPMFEYRKPAEWHMASDFCKASGASIHHEDVEATCPAARS
ncbi:MAG: hypothetical protein GYA24_19090 [Candidatus Lokiarchaeota archaeon]|nr:hypothetical protein [Candidatus Lokiarchaeota archaeon]